MKHADAVLLLAALLCCSLLVVIFLLAERNKQMYIQYVVPAQEKLSECVADTEDNRECDLYFVAWPRPTPKQTGE